MQFIKYSLFFVVCLVHGDHPTLDQCSNPSSFVSSPVLPSEELQVSCSCGDDNANGTEASCPDIFIDSEFTPYIVKKSENQTSVDNNCTTSWSLTARGDFFRRRRFDFKFDCIFNNSSVVASGVGTFEQSSHSGPCHYTGDCSDLDLQCFQKQCICYEDTPSFVPDENKCFPAADYGQRCIYDEQCETKTNNTVCKNNICQCKDNYSLNGDKQCVETPTQCLDPSADVRAGLTHLPSDKLQVLCSCSGDDQEKAGCPDITIDSEFLPFIVNKTVNQTSHGNNCTTTWNLTARGDLFIRRRFDFKFQCVFNNSSVASGVSFFEQSSYKGPCKYTSDCAGLDLQCENEKCICYDERPSFVPDENECFPAADYGQKCIYDEQCETNTNHTVCKDAICQCKDSYSLDDDKQCVPISDFQCLNASASFASEPHIPSDEVQVSCTCLGDDTKDGGCPTFAIDSEISHLIVNNSVQPKPDGNNCTTFWNFSARGELLTRRRLDVKVDCVFNNSKVASGIVSFEQNAHGKPCKYTGDCDGLDIQCQNGECACYGETPSFVPSENKCFPAADYGQMCNYNEQCETKTKDTVCKNNICECKDNFSLDGDKKCVKSDSRALLPHMLVILAALFLSSLKM